MKTIRTILLTTISLMMGTVAFAQEEKSIKKLFVYEISEDRNLTFMEARNLAIQNAHIEATKELFGISTTADTELINRMADGVSSEAYQEIISEALVGEWVWDNKNPEVNIDYDSENRRFNYHVLLDGKARRKTNAGTQLDWSLLTSEVNAGVESSVETKVVNGKKRIFVKFKSPRDGYAAIFWRDSKDDFLCMLPYKSSGGASYPIVAGKEYIFFDRGSDPRATPIALSTKQDAEINAMYIVFSPNSFSLPLYEDGGKSSLNTVKSKDFKEWLYKNRTYDRNMVEQHKWFKMTKN